MTAIALDQEKPEKVNEISRKIEQSEARIAGYETLITQNDEEVRRLQPAVVQLESQERLAARIKRRDELVAHGEKVCARINEKVRDLIVHDLVELDEIRDELSALHDIAGREAQTALCRLLNHETGKLVVDHALTDRTAWHDRALWQRRGDVVLTIQNLTPPKM
ncbi:MAG: hypothetical protein WBQ89_09835 [Candidatus Acidiferrum sp.]